MTCYKTNGDTFPLPLQKKKQRYTKKKVIVMITAL